jgi:hypothetical protein
MKDDYVLASLNPPSVWDFYPTAEAAAAHADEANAYNRRIVEQQGAPARHYEVMTYEAYKAAERQEYLSRPLRETSEETYRDAFEALPPKYHTNTGEFESFLMSEHWSGSYTSQYVAYKEKYFTRLVDATDRTTWITPQEINRLLGETPTQPSHTERVTPLPGERER